MTTNRQSPIPGSIEDLADRVVQAAQAYRYVFRALDENPASKPSLEVIWTTVESRRTALFLAIDALELKIAMGPSGGVDDHDRI